jgi:hypothetical protein
LPERTILEHLRPVAWAGIAALSALLTMPAAAAGRVVDRVVEGDVTGVVPLRAAGRGMPWRARVTIRLDDGLRQRLTYGRPFPRVGERVQLQLSDGELTPIRPRR